MLKQFKTLFNTKLNQDQVKSNSKRPRWSIFLATIIVSISCSVVIYQLSQIAESRNNIRLLLNQAKGQISRLNSLEWEGISKGKIDDNLAEELAENQQSTEDIFYELKRIDKNHNRLTSFFSLYRRYKTEIDIALELVAQGKTKQAIAIDSNAIDKIYDDLYTEASRLEKYYEGKQAQTRRLADVGTVFSLLLSAVIISVLSHKFSQNLWDKNQELGVAFQELQQTQNQLIQQEKMAALGQLISGIAHEINNPLGAIKASASNTDKALQEALADFPSLHQRLNSEEQESFFKLITLALNEKPFISLQESRVLKRKITAELQTHSIENARSIADLLIDVGVYKELEFLRPLLKSDHGEWALQFAYNLTCSFINNQVILSAVDRASKIVFALRSYARFDQSEQKQLIQVKDGLETVLEIYRNQFKCNINLVRDYQDTPPIWGYPDELIQVWTNLIHNAIQAMLSGGTLTLGTHHQDNGVEVTITDSGSGIPSEVQPKIFDPFFTTKPPGEGSGLGLYISQKIIDKHGGHIKVESQPGYTQFSAWLPIGTA
jgi:signal transduction histidine kinase